MASLNVSLSFFFATFVLCQAARRACKALLPAGAYASFAREAVGAAQLGACCLEMRMLAELGPWAGGFGPDLLLTLLTLLFLVHGATCDGAAANPTVSLQDFLLAEASVPRTLLKLAAQGLGVRAACALTRLYWAWELCDLHVLQNLLDPHCSSPLRTPVSHGALVEGAGAFFLHLTLLRLRNSLPAYRVPAVALLATVMTHTGMVLAVLLYHGRLPRLFQRNLLYSQKNKYRTPRGKPAPGPRDTQTPAEGCRSREPGRGGAGQPLPGSR
ncbi:aquaporin-12B-like isoform X2 [Acinonyx jubatus]|uniref:Aquaporin n=1 Tax=Acinonyx jubatus TaxID=32536 RepID=A0A6J1Y9N4_ACIJB|nr:aquaporin-12B-like isoform X2 [Acinonyx jubatus]